MGRQRTGVAVPRQGRVSPCVMNCGCRESGPTEAEAPLALAHETPAGLAGGPGGQVATGARWQQRQGTPEDATPQARVGSSSHASVLLALTFKDPARPPARGRPPPPVSAYSVLAPRRCCNYTVQGSVATGGQGLARRGRLRAQGRRKE